MVHHNKSRLYFDGCEHICSIYIFTDCLSEFPCPLCVPLANHWRHFHPARSISQREVSRRLTVSRTTWLIMIFLALELYVHVLIVYYLLYYIIIYIWYFLDFSNALGLTPNLILKYWHSRAEAFISVFQKHKVSWGVQKLLLIFIFLHVFPQNITLLMVKTWCDPSNTLYCIWT